VRTKKKKKKKPTCVKTKPRWVLMLVTSEPMEKSKMLEDPGKKRKKRKKRKKNMKNEK